MLENEVALITGASRGIGHAIALALGGAGAHIIGTSTSEQGAATLSAALASHGCNGRGAVPTEAGKVLLEHGRGKILAHRLLLLVQRHRRRAQSAGGTL